MKKTLLLLFSFCLITSTYGQQGELWTRINPGTNLEAQKYDRKTMPKEYQLYSLNFEQLKAKLATAPQREDNKTKPGFVIDFPTPEGKLARFSVYEASVMHPDLDAKYPDIKSYIGVGIDDPFATIRFSTTLFGLHTMTLSPNGTSYIDPYTKDRQNYIVYARKDLVSPNDFVCSTEGDSHDENETAGRNSNETQSNTGIFRTYRLAISSTVEYSNYHINLAGVSGGTTAQKKAAVLAAMNVTMVRVNGVYERDAAVRMVLVANNDLLISIDSDNFTNNSGSALLDENNNFINSTIGSGTYDIGHIFSTGGGGIAQLGSVCGSGKGRGVTGSSNPINDPFNIDYVAHEMGHQFGGTHTFRSNQGSCNGNVSNATSVEPGSGTTIMAYAGICGAHNVQGNSDAHFHAVSLAQIDAFVAGSGNCAVNTAMSNTAPVIGTLQNYTIPKSTAFILKGSATDAENNTLTYCWEQTNNESSTQPPVATSTVGPNFRSRTPSLSPERSFPILSSVLAGNVTPTWEVVPSVSRTMDFALTVRDNDVLNGGQTARKNVTVTTVAAAGPFVITAPNTNVSWEAGSNQTVTWNVAGTDANGINTAYVNIYMSSNAGNSFPVILASKVPNDGSELITVPNTPGSSNRILVSAYDNIFYDTSNTNFTITSPASPTFLVSINGAADGQNVTGCIGGNIEYTFNYATIGGFSGTTNFAATGLPAGVTAVFSPASTSTAGPITLTLSNTGSLAETQYSFVVNATSGATTKAINFYLRPVDPFFSTSVLTAPANNTTNQPTDLTLVWQYDFFGATAYDVQVALDAGFTNIVINATTSENTFLASDLQYLTDYYWRIRPRNGGCAGNFSNAYKFTTEENMGVGDKETVSFKIYPNPGNGNFTVQSDRVLSDKINIAVYDMQGRVIFERIFATSGTLDQTIRLNNPQAGVYLINISDGESKVVKRVIVK